MSASSRKNAKGEKIGPSINLRVNILFAVIFVLFMTLIGRLYYIQVINRQFYADKLKETGINTTITQSFPRGQIFDAKGRPLATTVTVPAVTFTRNPSMTAQDMRNSAIRLVPILRDFIDTSDLTGRDKRDYFLADSNNLSTTNAKLPESQMVDKNGKRLTDIQIYAKLINLVTDAQVNYQGDDLLAAELFKKMNATLDFATSNIVAGAITPVEQAQVAAQLSDLPGISLGESWENNIAQDNLLAPLIGTVGNIQPGDEASYLKKGYSLNDQVGTSYLEKSYESVLQGQKEITKIAVDSNGNIKSKTVTQAGAQGKNLKLTVDLDFENSVQQLAQNMMNQIAPGNPYSKGIYVVVLNAKTGAILAMNGITRDNSGKQTTDSTAPMLSAFTPGSVVKPATLTAGWESGVISGNQIITSQPLNFAGSNPIQDWWQPGFGPIPADAALEYSSNTYMAQVALKLLGQDYTPGMMVSTTNRVKAFNQMRSAFGQYGLGVDTGIDISLPNGDGLGIVPSTDNSNATVANLLFNAFGQFDTFTALQLAQYAQTIANNGVRLAPHIVEGIYSSTDSSLGKEVTPIAPKVMNKVGISQEDMAVIQLGMQEVVYGGHNSSMRTGADIGNGALVPIYAKTGTSETLTPDGSSGLTVNNIEAYAPGPNPQIAVGIMIPDVGAEADIHLNHTLLTQIVNLAVQKGVIK